MSFSAAYLARGARSLRAGGGRRPGGGLERRRRFGRLLRAAAALGPRFRGLPLRAVHIDHGLQAAAADFRAGLRRRCAASLSVPLTVIAVEVAEGPARRSRRRRAPRAMRRLRRELAARGMSADGASSQGSGRDLAAAGAARRRRQGHVGDAVLPALGRGLARAPVARGAAGRLAAVRRALERRRSRSIR